MWAVQLTAMREEGLTSFAYRKGTQERYSRHSVSVITALLQHNPKTSGVCTNQHSFCSGVYGLAGGFWPSELGPQVTHVPMVSCGLLVAVLILAGLLHVGGLS